MKKLWRTLGNLFGVRNPDDDIILPTGQRRSDIVAMHERALRESNEDRCERLGVTTSSNKSEQVRVGFSVSIKTEETPRPAKDASFDFSVLGSPCIVKYFSDYKYLEAVTDPEEYHYDPRRWVDVFFKEECYGYAWNEGLWTHSADLLEEKDQIEYIICQHFGTLLPPHRARRHPDIKTPVIWREISYLRKIRQFCC